MEDLFAKKGLVMDVGQAISQMRATAESFGLKMGDRRMTYNSRKAQELAKWAEQEGKGHEFHMAGFEAYFVDGLNLAKPEVLAGLAKKVGLDPGKALKALDDPRHQKAVDEDWRMARELGIMAVPTFCAGGQMVVGAKPYPQLAKLIERARA